MLLQPFNILFHHSNNSIIPKTVRSVLGSKYHHTSLILNEWHTLEVQYNLNTKIRHFDFKLGEFDGYRIPNLTDNQKVKMIEFIQRTLNSKYDFVEILNYFGFGLKDKDDKWICISWIDKLLSVSEIEVVKDIKIYRFDDLIDRYGLVKINE
jgi:hypothetical protein